MCVVCVVCVYACACVYVMHVWSIHLKCMYCVCVGVSSEEILLY